MVYYGGKCPHANFEPLPENEYDKVFSWTFDTSHYGIMSPLDRYKIMARLSTIDQRGEHGFSYNPDAFGFWSDYKWAKFANQAYLGIGEAVGKNDDRITKYFEEPLLKKKLIEPDEFFKFRFNTSKKLGKEGRKELELVLSRFEILLTEDKRLAITKKAIEEVANEVSDEKYRNARREHFNEFHIIK